MRAILNGMLISMVTLFFSTWFLCSSILKNLQALKNTSLFETSGIREKVQPQANATYRKNPERYYVRKGKLKFSRPSNPFGPKLRLQTNSDPFAPKLDLRECRPLEWKEKRSYNDYKKHSKPETGDYNKRFKESEVIHNTPIISGYKSYVDLLYKQMED